MDEKRRMVLDLFDGGEGGQSGGEAAGGTGAGETVVYGKQEEDAPQDGGHGGGEPELDIPAENEVCREIFFAFSKAGKAILRMTAGKASLEDIFMELTDSGKGEETK